MHVFSEWVDLQSMQAVFIFIAFCVKFQGVHFMLKSNKEVKGSAFNRLV